MKGELLASVTTPCIQEVVDLAFHSSANLRCATGDGRRRASEGAGEASRTVLTYAQRWLHSQCTVKRVAGGLDDVLVGEEWCL